MVGTYVANGNSRQSTRDRLILPSGQQQIGIVYLASPVVFAGNR